MDSEEKIAAMFAHHRRDAILLHRPYPPTNAAHSQSRFGGLPALPPGYDWPRMADGVPLHFLAQVDCGEIPFRCELPERGMLFFFGLESEEQIWDPDVVGDRPWRVIYAPDASGADPAHPAPPDLPPIGDGYPRPNWHPFLREGEAPPNVHVEWPIELRRIDTWPDASGLADGDFARPDGWRARFGALLDKRKHEQEWRAERERLWKQYEAAHNGKRADAFYAATGFDRSTESDEPYREVMDTALRLFGADADGDADAYPQRWIDIGFFCRALRVGLARASARAVMTDAEAHLAAADTWIATADAATATDRLPASDRSAFRRWLTSIARNDGPKDGLLEFEVCNWIIASTEAVIRSFAHDRDLARLIAPSVYETMASAFEGNSVFGVQYSQMLGHAPSSQQARKTDDPTLCLLSLASDAGLGWMFGDVGEASFWISPDALEQRDFGAAWATLEGG